MVYHRPIGITRSNTRGEVLMTVNGVNLELFTLAAIKADRDLLDEWKRHPNSFTSMGNGWYWFSYNCNRDVVYRAAGYDMHKIDFGFPIGWARQEPQRSRLQKGDQVVWSYIGKGNNMGRPLWDSEALRKVKGIVKRRLATRSR